MLTLFTVPSAFWGKNLYLSIINIIIIIIIIFRTLCSRRRYLDALLIINVFKGKINCHFIRHTFSIRVPAKQIQFTTFRVSCALRHRHSAGCISATNNICRFLDIFGTGIGPFEDTLVTRKCLERLYESVQFCFHLLSSSVPVLLVLTL